LAGIGGLGVLEVGLLDGGRHGDSMRRFSRRGEENEDGRRLTFALA
jgi:hypothetical protein